MKLAKQSKEPKIAKYSELNEADKFLHDCMLDAEIRTMLIKQWLSDGWTARRVINLLRGLGFNY